MKRVLSAIFAISLFLTLTGCDKNSSCKIEVQVWYQIVKNTKYYTDWIPDDVYCIEGVEGDFIVDEQCLEGKVKKVSSGQYVSFSRRGRSSAGKSVLNVPSGRKYLLVAPDSWGYAYKYVSVPSSYDLKIESVSFERWKEGTYVSNWTYVQVP